MIAFPIVIADTQPSRDAHQASLLHSRIAFAQPARRPRAFYSPLTPSTMTDTPEDAPMFSRKPPEKVELRGNPYLPDGAGNGSE